MYFLSNGKEYQDGWINGTFGSSNIEITGKRHLIWHLFIERRATEILYNFDVEYSDNQVGTFYLSIYFPKYAYQI